VKFLSLALLIFVLAVTIAAASDIPKDLLTQRDPFKMPEIPKNTATVSELEMYPVEQFKLIGVLEGLNGLSAMVVSPNGKTYFVKKGMVMGTQKGTIRKITDDALIVRERVKNVLGDLESVDTSITLPPESKQDVKTTTLEQGW